MLQRVFLASLALATAMTASAFPQIRASERGFVGQTIDGTTITIDYSRPQVRGREGVYGGEIPFGKVWTPGANWATTIDVTDDITINGHPMAAGKYSVWLQVQEDEWTAIFDPNDRIFHLFGPAESPEQIRFTVMGEMSDHDETLTWSFDKVRSTGAELRMDWADRSVAFDIRVQPSRDLTVTSELASRFVGLWRLDRGAPLGGGSVEFEITHEGNRLWARWENPPVPRLGRFWLIHLGSGIFAIGELEDGELFDIVMDANLEFLPLEGQATEFELRVAESLWATGTRN